MCGTPLRLDHRRSVGLVGVLRQMVKLQWMATLGIIGGMKSTLTNLLDAHAGLLPMELTLLCICHRAAVRLCSLPLSHPLFPLVREAHASTNDKHPDPIRNLLRIFDLNPWKFKNLAPDTTPQAFYAHVTPLIPKEQKNAITLEASDGADYRIYMDGSKHDGRVGAAATIF